MDRMSRTSCELYRQVVFNDPTFIKYFHSATPSSELGRMNIGSRPSKRKPNAGIEALRAIPWIFAWTQTRFHLPVWLGMGTAPAEVEVASLLPTLQQMYRQWPFFKVTIDMVEMVLAKADPRIMYLYERELVDPSLHGFGDRLRSLFSLTEAKLLAVTGHCNLLEGPTGALGAQSLAELKHKLDLRTPYITPLNILQAFYLRKQREMPTLGSVPTFKPTLPWAQELMKLSGNDGLDNGVDDIVLICIKGIASGMVRLGGVSCGSFPRPLLTLSRPGAFLSPAKHRLAGRLGTGCCIVGPYVECRTRMRVESSCALFNACSLSRSFLLDPRRDGSCPQRLADQVHVNPECVRQRLRRCARVVVGKQEPHLVGAQRPRRRGRPEHRHRLRKSTCRLFGHRQKAWTERRKQEGGEPSVR